LDYENRIRKYYDILANNEINARTYFKNNSEKRKGKSGVVNDFPDNPGVYVIVRKNEYTKKPLVLYVGKTTTIRSIKERLGDHFSSNKPNVCGSYFCKVLMQICQNEECVNDIRWSDNTLVYFIGLKDYNDEFITDVCNFTNQKLKPKLND